MSRYFAEISFLGRNYCGWQRQPNAKSVQEIIELWFSRKLENPTAVIGCGRTDAGVHARSFFLHFDVDTHIEDLPQFINELKICLPKDIAVHRIFEVDQSEHARFSATSRSYRYLLTTQKMPFHQNTRFYYSRAHLVQLDLLNEAADLLLQYQSFKTFCKTNSDVRNYDCILNRSVWEQQDHIFTYNIGANRFLRGMVRMIVGMCLKVCEGQLSLAEVKKALDTQSRLEKSWSVPPQGLFLSSVEYPQFHSRDDIAI